MHSGTDRSLCEMLLSPLPSRISSATLTCTFQENGFNCCWLYVMLFTNYTVCLHANPSCSFVQAVSADQVIEFCDLQWNKTLYVPILEHKWSMGGVIFYYVGDIIFTVTGCCHPSGGLPHFSHFESAFGQPSEYQSFRRWRWYHV